MKHVRALFALAALAASCARPLSSPALVAHTESTHAVADSAVALAAPGLDTPPVQLAPPSLAARARSVLVLPTRWQSANSVRVEHRAFALARTTHVRLVVRGVGSESAPGRSLRDSLRLALALEEGGTRRNPAPLFGASLSQAGADLRVEAGRQGLVLSLDATEESAGFVLRKLGEIASEPAVSRDAGAFADWVARSTHPERESLDRSVIDTRRAALSALRGSDLPWSPREWTEVSASFAWASPEDTTSRGLAREALRAGAMTLIVAGSMSADEARAALASERWPAVGRGAGISVAPLPSLSSSAPVRAMHRTDARASVAIAFGVDAASTPAAAASVLVLSRLLERCARAPITSSLYEDPARGVLALSASAESPERLSATATAVASELDRVIDDRCFERSFDAEVSAMIEQRNPSDPARWADVRAWAAHDGRSDESEQALLDAASALTVESARAAIRAWIASASRVVVSSGPAARAGALCAVSGVRAVRVGRDDRACP